MGRSAKGISWGATTRGVKWAACVVGLGVLAPLAAGSPAHAKAAPVAHLLAIDGPTVPRQRRGTSLYATTMITGAQRLARRSRRHTSKPSIAPASRITSSTMAS